MSFEIKPSKFRKVQADASVQTCSDETQRLEMIVKVNKAGYVPRSVRLRARIDETMFTCDAKAGELQALEDDPCIESVSVSRPLRVVD